MRSEVQTSQKNKPHKKTNLTKKQTSQKNKLHKKTNLTKKQTSQKNKLHKKTNFTKKQTSQKNKPHKKQFLLGSCSGFVWVTFGKMAFNPNKTSFIPKDDRTNLAFKKLKF
ncbi:hypothetical protein QNH98_02705 [Myroides sp. mNGS23_01]|nr:hypothetical protein [Myroides sp. mNGS23_01]WHT39624.1 hypothetical protein QNH98_02705 [Myroides sp. mNGS23_01]